MKIKNHVYITAILVVLFLFIFAGCDSTAKEKETKKEKETEKEKEEESPVLKPIPPVATNLQVTASAEYISKSDGRLHHLTVRFEKGSPVAGSTLKPENIIYAVTYIEKDGTNTRTATELVAAITDKALDAIKKPNPETTPTKTYGGQPYVLSNNIIAGLSVPFAKNEILFTGLKRNTAYEIIITASTMANGIIYTSLSDVKTKTTLDVDPKL